LGSSKAVNFSTSWATVKISVRHEAS